VLLQVIIFGLVQGSILALATVGFAMTRQTEGFLNIAHGQYLAIGAFLGLVYFDNLGLNVFVAGLLVVLSLGLIGVTIARVVFDPVRKRGALVLLFTSIGLAYALYGAVIAIFGTDVKLFSVSFGESIAIGSASITVGEIIIIALALVTVVGLWLFLTFTRLGMWVRAVASNPELARVRGIRVQIVSSTVWFLSAGLAGLAGMLLAIIGSASPELGWANILVILAVAVMGGVGRIYAVIAAGLLLGLVMSLSAEVIPIAYQTVVAFGVLVLVLVVRPEGLFAVKRRREIAAA
jgi:branched-chain amino acid transport system permease protein